MDKQLILLVDDNQDNLELLKFQIEILNFSCICASEGRTAISLAQTYQPNLILLDIVMPNMSGFEVIKCLKQDSKTATIPIIVVTSLAMVQDRVRIFLAGANGCITKPYELNTLEVVIHYYLSRISSPNLLLEPLGDC